MVEQQSGSKHPNANMKAKLRPKTTRIKKQSKVTTTLRFLFLLLFNTFLLFAWNINHMIVLAYG
jgi:hypothetical protein